MTYDLRARPLVVLLLLFVAAAAAALLVLQRRHTERLGLVVGEAGGHGSSTAVEAGRLRTVSASARPKPKPKKVVAPPDQLPRAIRLALAADRVVVVALYDPRAKIDGTAMREARAGAEKAGSSFVPVDVRDNGDVDSLNAKYGVLQDPAVLVLRPPGSLVVRIDGFADRETVAQAALNAAS